MKYYSIERPVEPWSYPEPKDNPVKEIWNFNGPIFCEQIGRQAWGYVVYEKPLNEDAAYAYDLMPEGRKTWYCVVSSFYDNGRVTANITASKLADEKPESSFTSLRRKDVYADWYDSYEAAQKAVTDARNA